ncbi:O109 family O-antigen polymerase, partial [Escherichia coli]|nr:O109 family O-antigen polymerase [Escherichia coli]
MGCTTNQNLIYKSRVSVGSVIVLLVFCIYLFMPPMIMVLLSQSSLSAGMMVVATLFHISFAHYKILNYKILTAVLLILIYGTVSTFYSPDMKPLFSAIALIYIYTATVKFLKYLQEIHDLDAKKAIS